MRLPIRSGRELVTHQNAFHAPHKGNATSYPRALV
jgi:hypothetical protein